MIPSIRRPTRRYPLWRRRDNQVARGVGEGYAEIVEKILRNGADVNAPNADGRTPLDIAENCAYVERFEASGDKEPYFRRKAGRLLKQYLRIIAMLEKRGAIRH
jgi:hypothetical protein